MLVRPVMADELSLVGRVLGRAGTRRDGCWCQRFRLHAAPDNWTALQEELLHSGIPVGLLALEGEEPVGWARVVPRSSLPGITGNRALARVLEADPSAWWVACTVVRQDHRGRGVGVQLLQAAVDWAAGNGATVLEGHPVDTSGVRGHASPSALFTGTQSSFAAAGFTEIGRTYRTRPVMRRELRTTAEEQSVRGQ